jgi:quinol-cytochrome oxidoreductase complex cytochrome b subunit
MTISRLITNSLLFQIIWDHIGSYPAPKNINYSWSFGALSGICLVIQILSGLFLSMHYIPEVSSAFSSVEHIMRDVNYGWFLRYLHANGASMFFLVIFFHIFRNFYFGSYQNPRILLWFSGIIIFFLLMATAFLGYVLPWGQMSFWGATVITNLFSAIPIYGTTIVEWLWGGFSVDQSTLNRFYSLHFFLPFIIAALALIHLALLHQVGSNDPICVDSNKENLHPATIPFYPYFVMKDFYAVLIMFFILLMLVFFAPNLLGHPDNYIPADPMVTPAHIVPEWYFLPFYAILRSIPDKLGGVLAMVLAILGWLVLPVFAPTHRSPVFKPYYKTLIWFFGANFILLGWIGQQPVEYPYTELGALCTTIYFFILFILIPFLFIIEDFSKKS